MKLGLMGDYVMVIHEPFRGYFAVVTDNSYGDKSEIQYFQNKEKWWILIENDFDSCLANELNLLKERLMKDLIIFSNYNFSQNMSWKTI